MWLNVNTSEAGDGGGTMNTQQSLVDGSPVCQTSEFKVVNRTKGSDNKIQWNYRHPNGT